MLAVDRPREYLCGGRLARTAGAREQIGMRNRTLADLIHQGADDVFLSYHRRKRIGTVFAVQRNVCHFLHFPNTLPDIVGERTDNCF